VAYRDHAQFVVHIKPMLRQTFIAFCKDMLSATNPGLPLGTVLKALKDEETVASLQAAPWNFSTAKAQAFMDVLTAVANLRSAIQTAKTTLES